MKKLLFALMGGALIFASCGSRNELKIQFPDRFEGKDATLAIYSDSTELLTLPITNGEVTFDYSQMEGLEMPRLVQVMVDGRVRAVAVAEEGTTTIDSTYTISGTPLNERFNRLMNQCDSVESLDDMELYNAFVKKLYQENKTTPLGEFFGTELIRFAETPEIESILADAPATLKNSHRVKRYVAAAKLRSATAPGAKFIDFAATQPSGKTAQLSDYAGKGKWVLVDFWASWCPYCIKDLPKLDSLYTEFAPAGLEIVGVAVRDKAEDTSLAIEKHGIRWPVIYNAEQKPYEIYGFTGIPHLMLIRPDGVIESRGETPQQVSNRLRKALNAPNK
jgi:peroxiredoxin